MNNKKYPQLISIEKEFNIKPNQIVIHIENEPTIYGYNYKLFIKVYNHKLDEKGMVYNFEKLNDFQIDVLDKYFENAIVVDYSYESSFDFKNEKIYCLPTNFKTTSTENLCKHIYDLLLEYFKDNKYSKPDGIDVIIKQTDENTVCFYHIDDKFLDKKAMD